MKLELWLHTFSLQLFMLVPLAETTTATAVAMELTMEMVFIHEIKISQKTTTTVLPSKQYFRENQKGSHCLSHQLF